MPRNREDPGALVRWIVCTHTIGVNQQEKRFVKGD